MLLHIPTILSRTQATSMQERLAAANWTDGRETVGPQGAQVKHNLQLPETSPLRQELGNEILDALARSPLYFAATLPLRTLPPRFNCYQENHQYGFHVDGAVMSLPIAPGHTPASLRSDISCTLFLNDPDEYEGGELIIADTYGEHEVKLPAGDLIIYPSTSLHRVAPVTRGMRIASFFWVQSLVRQATHRHQLLELDTAIQSLTASNTDHNTILRLTNIYHNLLREWSET
ncbi:Fe2+-dependent dioxygenase [Xylella fastidiosa]|uniref:PKHD-type hydroxylase XF_0598 n=2 Tax=Xylella fastidiosa TaxID=2371 RepID=Y598_XYLFA|nr:Fe2+-dependent dioxygenase [Xylella fastidiosa]Q9PFQ9.1 RecName: Full=PKHD-type hydroxylase XF_0598 [Xylella fastidiosa 9a5c]AAF83408.1 conserved hypothetical protein [Xylella fastidiosa 9a5c]ALQ94210.1 Fe(II)-dependent oxygenase [Xylella fastidiosa]ALR03675.1 Fe2+-dependent dioxygenase [Xylella fastidiosa]ALR05900.1 Fe2+-dependent dioxygenase [Xylella fastidiosa]ALR08292.2 Fe2+-dependent dioxygenase [Xylella fastidiosa]